MRFEDALFNMRQGKKIRHPDMESDEYFQACYVRINPLFCPEGTETFEKMKERGISIVKMKGSYQHPDMMSGSVNKLPEVPTCDRKDLHSMPQLNLFWIMSDEWESFE